MGSQRKRIRLLLIALAAVVCAVLAVLKYLQAREEATGEAISPQPSLAVSNLEATDYTDSEGTIYRQALGPQLQIVGDLYDARNSKFIESNIIPEATITFVQDQKTNIQIIESHNLNDIHQQLSLSQTFSVELQYLSHQMSGSASYLMTSKKYKDSDKCDIYWSRTLGTDKTSSVGSIDQDVASRIEQMGATHVVKGVVRGARAIVEFESQDFLEAGTADGDPQGDLATSVTKIIEEEEVNLSQYDENLIQNSKLNFRGDLPGPNELTTEGIVEYFRALNDVVDAMNDGRGAVIGYVLEPIENLIDNANVVEHRIDIEYLEKLREVSRTYQETTQMLNQILKYYREMPRMVNDVMMDEARELFNCQTENHLTFKDKVSYALAELRTTGEATVYDEALALLNRSDCSLNAASERSQIIFEEAKRLYSTYKYFEGIGAEFVKPTLTSMKSEFIGSQKEFVIAYLFSDVEEQSEEDFNQFIKVGEKMKQIEFNQGRSGLWVLNLDSVPEEKQQSIKDEFNNHQVAVFSSAEIQIDDLRNIEEYYVQQEAGDDLGDLEMLIPTEQITYEMISQQLLDMNEEATEWLYN